MGEAEAREFSSPTWFKATVGVLAIAMPGVTALVLKLEGFSFLGLSFAAMSVIGLAGLLEVVVLAVIIDDDELRIRGVTKRRNIPKSEIARVTWEGGCGVSIQLNDGKWVKLPDVGKSSQALTNSIRAWLKRGDASHAES